MKDAAIIKGALDADIPVLLWGAPGTGKTAYIRALAEEYGAHIETLIGSTLDPVAVAGLPVVHGDKVVVAPPEWALRLQAALKADQPAWLFFDELSCAPPSVQAAILRIVHERVVDGINLTGVRMLAASNPTDTAADGGILAPATANRWVHIDWKPDIHIWAAGEITNWGKQQNEKRGSIAAKVASFLSKKQDVFATVPKDTTTGSRAWPSPRSWSAAITLLSFVRPESEGAALASCVGEGAAAEYITYSSALDLPDPEELLKHGKLPTRGDQIYAALLSLVATVAIERKDKTARVKRAWDIIAKCSRVDVAVSAGQALRLAVPSVVTPEAINLGNRILGVKSDVA